MQITFPKPIQCLLMIAMVLVVPGTGGRLKKGEDGAAQRKCGFDQQRQIRDWSCEKETRDG